LIDLRKSVPSLHSRLFSIITPDAVPQTVFSFIRYGEPSDAPVIVLLNFSEEPAEFRFDVPEQFSSALPGGSSLYDLLAEENLPGLSGGRMQISVPAQTARILAAQPAQ
jgi:hypothetical protein